MYTVLHIVCVVHYMTKGSGSENDSLLENLRLELRRGCLVLAVLAELRTEQYGYTLRKGLADRGLEVDEGTLYPLLRRLESQGLLASEWREEDKRNKRFYKISRDGKLVLKQLVAEWENLDASLRTILKGEFYGSAKPVPAGS
jgi:PadR family transcriptional regulator